MQNQSFARFLPAPSPEKGQTPLLIAVWVVASLLLIWQLTQGPSTFGGQASVFGLAVMLICTVLLLRWADRQIPRDLFTPRTSKAWLLLTALTWLGFLLLLNILLGKRLMFALPVIGLLALLWLRPHLTFRQLVYAGALALVAGITGLAAGWITFVPLGAWAVLQVFLVTTGLTAGWTVLRRTGLAESGIGQSRFLNGGAVSAARGFLLGILLAMPWALAALVMGGIGGPNHQWISEWWHPFSAVETGIAEEAWGRLLLVPLIYLFLRRVSSSRTALLVAILVAGYWFAYLHTASDPNFLNVLVSTFILGTFAALPLSYLVFFRDLETAIGFHFWIDFLQFACSWVLLQTARP